MRILSVVILFLFGICLSAQTLVLKTSEGDIVVELFPDVAPKAVENFVTLAEQGYYDGTIFHRVIQSFMIQGGDPDGTGRGGQSIWGKAFVDEFKPYVNFDRAGLLAMANAGPNTNKSQFFITTIPTPWLNGRHTIFGEVVEGMDVVRAIEKTAVGAMDKPIKPQTILTITKEQ
ncbi:MAG: peptidylprolyl isomerase [Campylobacteraceae bacterium]|nr:peptidylprolyl isomerase [Campylobacteraceae bacterium]